MLSLVHRLIRFLQNGSRFVQWAEQRNSSGCTCVDRLSFEYERQLIDGILKGFRFYQRVLFGEIPQQQSEFIPAQSSDHVRRSYMAHQHCDDAFQNDISGRMAEGIVDRFEAVDIEHNQRAGRRITLDVGNGARKLALKSPAIVDIQQEVGIGPSLQLVDARMRGCELCPERTDRFLRRCCV